MAWIGITNISSREYICPYCSNKVASAVGYYKKGPPASYIYICPHCDTPTYFEHSRFQYPDSPYGNSFKHIDSEDINGLYEEARRCISVNAFTASVMLCRKIIMNVAVHHDAKENLKFKCYVDFLYNQNIIPKNSKNWVDFIRKTGNEANHEIPLVSKEDATYVFEFTAYLLEMVYEKPKMFENLKRPPKD